MEKRSFSKQLEELPWSWTPGLLDSTEEERDSLTGENSADVTPDQGFWF